MLHSASRHPPSKPPYADLDPQAAETMGRSRLPAWGWMILIWALLIFPPITLRGLHYEEGTK
jgi:hypothetical protein